MVSYGRKGVCIVIRVFLLDNNRLFLEGLVFLLEKREDIKVVGVATKARNVLRSIERTSPDVVIMDFVLPDANGAHLVQEIRRRWKHIRVVILSLYDNQDFQEEAKKSGAFAYLVKGGPIEELLSTLYAAYENGRRDRL
uniref:Response regulator transcription factor n=1 Tax=Candidatus Caldatribacterium saccharofermentans TaxID=1454753 RepID=A0A7V4WKC9_9BACT